jgi:hypothetical protein
MIERVQQRIDDRAYWNDDRVKALLNQIKDDITQELKVVAERKYTFSSTKGLESYAIPHGFISNHLLHYGEPHWNIIEIVGSPKGLVVGNFDVSLEGVPRVGYIWGESGRKQINIYPTFNVDGIEISWWFYGWPEDMTNDNDEPQFPAEWHPSLPKLAINEAKVDDDQMSPADAEIIKVREIRKLRGLATTNFLNSQTDSRLATIDDKFPVRNTEPIVFNVTTDGGIW